MTSRGEHLRLDKGAIVRNRYEVITSVGSGNFSKVYRVLDTYLSAKEQRRRPVAMKVIKKEYSSDAKYEKQMLIALHKNDAKNDARVSKMYECFVYQECPVFIMPIHGPSLRSRRLGVNRGVVTHEKLLEFALDILETMDFVHFQCHMVHTDLKPENILIADSGVAENSMGDEWVVCDFGSASLWRMDKLDSDLISTRPYRAPEVVLGNKWHYAADMWSVGCILYEVAIGHRLFEIRDDMTHLHMMDRRVGRLPDAFTRHAKYSNKFFNARGDFLSTPDVIRYGKCRLTPLRDMFKEDREFLRLLEGLLAYDPDERMTATEALALPLFDAVRTARDARLRQAEADAEARRQRRRSNYLAATSTTVDSSTTVNGVDTRESSVRRSATGRGDDEDDEDARDGEHGVPKRAPVRSNSAHPTTGPTSTPAAARNPQPRPSTTATALSSTTETTTAKNGGGRTSTRGGSPSRPSHKRGEAKHSGAGATSGLNSSTTTRPAGPRRSLRASTLGNSVSSAANLSRSTHEDAGSPVTSSPAPPSTPAEDRTNDSAPASTSATPPQTKRTAAAAAGAAGAAAASGKSRHSTSSVSNANTTTTKGRGRATSTQVAQAGPTQRSESQSSATRETAPSASLEATRAAAKMPQPHETHDHPYRSISPSSAGGVTRVPPLTLHGVRGLAPPPLPRSPTEDATMTFLVAPKRTPRGSSARGRSARKRTGRTVSPAGHTRTATPHQPPQTGATASPFAGAARPVSRTPSRSAAVSSSAFRPVEAPSPLAATRSPHVSIRSSSVAGQPQTGASMPTAPVAPPLHTLRASAPSSGSMPTATAAGRSPRVHPSASSTAAAPPSRDAVNASTSMRLETSLTTAALSPTTSPSRPSQETAAVAGHQSPLQRGVTAAAVRARSEVAVHSPGTPQIADAVRSSSSASGNSAVVATTGGGRVAASSLRPRDDASTTDGEANYAVASTSPASVRDSSHGAPTSDAQSPPMTEYGSPRTATTADGSPRMAGDGSPRATDYRSPVRHRPPPESSADDTSRTASPVAVHVPNPRRPNNSSTGNGAAVAAAVITTSVGAKTRIERAPATVSEPPPQLHDGPAGSRTPRALSPAARSPSTSSLLGMGGGRRPVPAGGSGLATSTSAASPAVADDEIHELASAVPLSRARLSRGNSRSGSLAGTASTLPGAGSPLTDSLSYSAAPPATKGTATPSSSSTHGGSGASPATAAAAAGALLSRRAPSLASPFVVTATVDRLKSVPPANVAEMRGSATAPVTASRRTIVKSGPAAAAPANGASAEAEAGADEKAAPQPPTPVVPTDGVDTAHPPAAVMRSRERSLEDGRAAAAAAAAAASAAPQPRRRPTQSTQGVVRLSTSSLQSALASRPAASAAAEDQPTAEPTAAGGEEAAGARPLSGARRVSSPLPAIHSHSSALENSRSVLCGTGSAGSHDRPCTRSPLSPATRPRSARSTTVVHADLAGEGGSVKPLNVQLLRTASPVGAPGGSRLTGSLPSSGANNTATTTTHATGTAMPNSGMRTAPMATLSLAYPTAAGHRGSITGGSHTNLTASLSSTLGASVSSSLSASLGQPVSRSPQHAVAPGAAPNSRRPSMEGVGTTATRSGLLNGRGVTVSPKPSATYRRTNSPRGHLVASTGSPALVDAAGLSGDSASSPMPPMPGLPSSQHHPLHAPTTATATMTSSGAGGGGGGASASIQSPASPYQQLQHQHQLQTQSPSAANAPAPLSKPTFSIVPRYAQAGVAPTRSSLLLHAAATTAAPSRPSQLTAVGSGPNANPTSVSSPKTAAAPLTSFTAPAGRGGGGGEASAAAAAAAASGGSAVGSRGSSVNNAGGDGGAVVKHRRDARTLKRIIVVRPTSSQNSRTTSTTPAVEDSRDGDELDRQRSSTNGEDASFNSHPATAANRDASFSSSMTPSPSTNDP